MRVIIAGGRDFSDYDQMVEAFEQLFLYEGAVLDDDLTIVTGGAKGADSLGYQLGAEYELPQSVYHAAWDDYGPAAGPIRNAAMAAASDVLLAFWDGQSRGTLNMIDTALKEGLEVHVYRY